MIDVNIVEYRIQSRGRVAIKWSDGGVTRHAVSVVGPELKYLFTLDPATMEEGAVVKIDAQGRVTRSALPGMVRAGRKLVTDLGRPMTGAERARRAYAKRKGLEA